MSGPESLPHLDRLALSQALAKLPDPQFKQVVFALQPPPGILPADSSPLGDRVASLLQWVENNGPGLAVLQRVLGQVSQSSEMMPAQAVIQGGATPVNQGAGGSPGPLPGLIQASLSSPIKTILILAANPKDTQALRIDEEVREIEEGLRRSRHRDQFQIRSAWAVRPDDLRRALLDHQPQIVHFAGHGAGQRGLVLENSSGQGQPVRGEALARLFSLFKDQVECVLLNACYSAVQAEAIHQQINCVIGMDQAIGDRAAIKFATGFYDGLGAGRAYDEAFQLGLTAIDLEGIPETATPQLLHCSPRSPQRSSDTPAAASDPALFLVSMPANPFFTGRETLLTDIHRTLSERGRAALYGLGGLGKTQTARAYVEQHRSAYRQVFWLRAATLEEVFLGYSEMARALALPEADQPDQLAIAAAVKRWLESPEHHRWLLVLDNADDLPTLRPYLPLQGTGHLLFTTRAQALGEIAEGLELTKMEESEGATFLLRRAKRIEPEAALTAATAADQDLARQLVTATDGLPLALDQAGAFIEEQGSSLGEYLKLFEAEKVALLQERGELAGDHPSVWVTFSLAFAKVAEANPASADLVRVCAFLAPDAIPEELFHQGAAMLGEAFSALADQPLQRTKAMGEASRFSLISRNPDTQTLAIHRLVQTVVRAELDGDSQRAWAGRVVNAVTAVFPNADYEQWGTCDRLISQALAAIQLLADYGIKSRPAPLLLSRTGYYFEQKGLYSEAEPLYQNALAFCRESLGDYYLAVTTNLKNVSILIALYKAIRYTEVKFVFRFVYRSQSRKLQVGLLRIIKHNFINSPYHQFALNAQAIIPTLSNLASLYKTQGRYEEAESLFLEALALDRKLSGKRHPDVASSLNDLAALYYDQGRYGLAEPLFLEALALDRKLLDHLSEETRRERQLDFAQSLNNLAYLYNAQGRYAEAEPLFQQALALRQELLGERHPYIAESLNNLAEFHCDQGRYAEAEPLFQQALTLRRELLGERHSHVAQSLNNLAALYDNQGRYAEAEPLFQQALTLRRELWGERHPAVAESFNDLAKFHCDQGRYGLAEPLFQQALTLRRELLGERHPDVARSLNNLAYLYNAQGRYEAAAPLYQQALELRREILGERHPDVATSLFNLGALRYNQERYPEALDLLLEAEAIYLSSLGADHPTTQALQSWLALTRAALGSQTE